MNQALADLGDYIGTVLMDTVTESRVAHDELTVVAARDAVPQVLSTLRDDVNLYFRVLIDLCGVDYPGREPRFDVVYHLLSLKHNQRIRVVTRTDAHTPVPTVTHLYSAATWFERECWDMYGVLFADNPDLRRMLSDYGFEGHPLRKDFPLSGHTQVRYDETQKRVVYEPVNLTQEYRDFDFLSPWEAMTAMPGDTVLSGRDDSAEGEA